MRQAILPLSLVFGSLALVAAFVWWIFESQREDVAVARSFLTNLATQDFDASRALMTPLLSATLTESEINRAFGRLEEWDRLRIGQRSSTTSGGSRQTEMWGLGTTISGCESELYVRTRDGLVDAINITPICPSPSVDA
ncbi:hypothetical protein HKCCE4037_08165 [Rhodobacterales bacterium HKCCE4037]|nr:hypothetical protein [Rhodobacterales bacterium HKCCE4037]